MDRARHGSGALTREQCSFASVAHLRAGKLLETDARERLGEDFLDLRDGPGQRLIEPARACARFAPGLVDCGSQNVPGADAVAVTAELIAPMRTAYALENAVVHQGLHMGSR